MAGRDQAVKVVSDHGPWGWTLFVAWVGAVIYFYQQDPGFVGFIIALFKGAVWPAYVIYQVLGLLGI